MKPSYQYKMYCAFCLLLACVCSFFPDFVFAFPHSLGSSSHLRTHIKNILLTKLVCILAIRLRRRSFCLYIKQAAAAAHEKVVFSVFVHCFAGKVVGPLSDVRGLSSSLRSSYGCSLEEKHEERTFYTLHSSSYMNIYGKVVRVLLVSFLLLLRCPSTFPNHYYIAVSRRKWEAGGNPNTFSASL